MVHHMPTPVLYNSARVDYSRTSVLWRSYEGPLSPYPMRRWDPHAQHRYTLSVLPCYPPSLQIQGTDQVRSWKDNVVVKSTAHDRSRPALRGLLQNRTSYMYIYNQRTRPIQLLTRILKGLPVGFRFTSCSP